MNNIFTTAYKKEGFHDIITSIVKLYNPKVAVEIGVQQGSSAISIGRGMTEESTLYLYDRFTEKYSDPPYKSTGADQSVTIQNLIEADLKCQWVVLVQDAYRAHERHQKGVDLLHLDISNTAKSIGTILPKWLPLVSSVILLEGGITNNWMREYSDLKPYWPLLECFWIQEDWTYITLTADNHYALTVLTRKQKD